MYVYVLSGRGQGKAYHLFSDCPSLSKKPNVLGHRRHRSHEKPIEYVMACGKQLCSHCERRRNAR